MGSVDFKFNLNGVSGEFRYENDGGESGRLNLSFSSSHIEGRRFSLSFNAIGKGDPLGFLESLDEGYLNDKASGLSGNRPDLFETISRIRKTLDDPCNELSADHYRMVEETIDRAASSFEGDHMVSCQSLIWSLSRQGIPCFQDDIGGFMGYRKSSENVLFHQEVWPGVLMAIEDHLEQNPCIDEDINSLRKGSEDVLEM